MSYIHKSYPDTDYVSIPNALAQNKSLSFKARGVLLYLLSKPIDWKVYIKEIANNGKEGRDSVRSAINELMDVGYIIRTQNRDKGRIKDWIYYVYDTPNNADIPTLSPDTEKQHLAKPDMANPTLQSKEYTKKENTKYIYTSEKTGETYTLAEIYTIFLKDFNTVVGSHYKGSDKIKSKLGARLKDGYTPEEIASAVRTAKENGFLMGDNESGKRYLTPEYILRADKLDEWLNSKPKQKKNFFSNNI